MLSGKKIAVLYGGLSGEREVSLRSGKAIITSLEKLGATVTPIDVDRNVYDSIKQVSPDICFNALHGTYGEDGCIQGILEFLQIPYTHSGVMASSVAMNKALTKRILSTVDVPMARGAVLAREEILATNFTTPTVIKPIEEGSTLGIQFLEKGGKVDATNLRNDKTFLVEDFIKGRELSVAVLNGKGLGIVEIRPKQGFYDYTNKYTAGASEYLVPAPIPAEIYSKALKIAEDAHKTLGCRGVTRSDIIYREDDSQLFFLEINTHPGMTETSLVPKIAASQNISFEDLMVEIVNTAALDK